MFTRAIVRPPATNFAAGLTSVDLGIPDVALALEQHQRYCRALESCGLVLSALAADSQFPDSTFVEDTAILTPRCGIITRPGAASRMGETVAIEAALKEVFSELAHIEAPGTVDGGDICEADDHFFIGISERTNQAGGNQLAAILARHGYTSQFVDIRGTPGILHLKSGLTALGDRRLIVIDALAGHPAFSDYEVIRVDPHEEYAANCIRVNHAVLIPSGYPRLAERIAHHGYPLIPLDMSEFQKMDGGLSCLSLRF